MPGEKEKKSQKKNHKKNHKKNPTPKPNQTKTNQNLQNPKKKPVPFKLQRISEKVRRKKF